MPICLVHAVQAVSVQLEALFRSGDCIDCFRRFTQFIAQSAGGLDGLIFLPILLIPQAGTTHGDDPFRLLHAERTCA